MKMATVIRIVYNNQNPPPGIRDYELLHMALARLRMILLSRVTNCGVTGVVIVNNGSVMADPDIVNRLGAIPILETVQDWTVFELKVSSGPDISRRIQSDDITLTTGRPAPVLKGIYISELPINETFKGFLVIKKSSVHATKNPHFSPIANITFRALNEVDMEFIVEMVRGYTKEDFKRVYDEAKKIMSSDLDIFSREKETRNKYPNSLAENLRELGIMGVLNQPVNGKYSSSSSTPPPLSVDKIMIE